MRDVESNGHGTLEKARTDGGLTSEIGTTTPTPVGNFGEDEFTKQLRGRRKIKIYREMQDNDPVVGGVLYALQMLVQQVGWHTDAADTPNGQRWADFCDECLHDMSLTWDQTLTGILSFLPFGWAWEEIVYKIRGGQVEDGTRRSSFSDGLIGWRKFGLRTQDSLEQFVFDEDGGLQGMKQLGVDEAIPIEKSLLFRTTAARGDPEGRSILRNAYVPWYRKKRIEEIEAIGIERDLAGLPVARIPSSMLGANASESDKQAVEAYKELVTRIKRNTQEGVVWPSAFDDNNNELYRLELLTSGGRRQFDTDAIVSRYSQQIAQTVLADFIMLGHEAVGSKALGSSKVELFRVALGAWIDEIASVMNQYAVPRLMTLNGVPQDDWPTLAHDEIADVDLTALGTFLNYAGGSGFLTPSPELEDRLREMADLPPLDEEQIAQMNEPPEPEPPQPQIVPVPVAAQPPAKA